MDNVEKQNLLTIAYNFLLEQSMGTIATVAGDGTPECAYVNYSLDDGWRIYILTKKDSRKVQNIHQNSHVAFAVGGPNIPHTVQIQAEAKILEEESQEYSKVFQILKNSKKLERDPIYNIFSHNYVILELTITWLRWLSFDRDTGNEVYTVLIPESG